MNDKTCDKCGEEMPSLIVIIDQEYFNGFELCQECVDELNNKNQIEYYD